MAQWLTTVSNIGTVYNGTNGFAATKEFLVYMKQSRQGTGKAGGETVTLLKDGVVHREYVGKHEGSTGQEEVEPAVLPPEGFKYDR